MQAKSRTYTAEHKWAARQTSRQDLKVHMREIKAAIAKQPQAKQLALAGRFKVK